MGKKDLKKQYPDLDVSVIDYVSRMDPSKTKKITPLLLKIISKKVSDDRRRARSKHLSGITENRIDQHIVELLLDIVGEGFRTLSTLKEFNEHLENNRIENTDLNTYETWQDILAQKGLADMKLLDKELTKQAERIYEDSTWLVIKPLSFSASLAYGSGTRWCTAMKNEPSYFYRYSSEGILIYVINKKEGKKFGVYSNHLELSFWDVIDNRIDSMASGIPHNVLSVIAEKIDFNKNQRNCEFFSEEELKNRDNYWGESKSVEFDVPYPEEEPTLAEVVEYEDNVGYEDQMDEYDAYESQVYEEPTPEIAIARGSYFDLINDDNVQQG
jgi:hypothetical protein